MRKIVSVIEIIYNYKNNNNQSFNCLPACCVQIGIFSSEFFSEKVNENEEREREKERQKRDDTKFIELGGIPSHTKQNVCRQDTQRHHITSSFIEEINYTIRQSSLYFQPTRVVFIHSGTLQMAFFLYTQHNISCIHI